MRLLFDLGNTRVKWALEESGQLSHHGGLSHNDLSETILDAELARIPFADSAISSAWLSSVASKPIESVIEQWVRSRCSLEVDRAIVTDHAGGISNKYADLSQLGVDRWLAALGARKFRSEGDVIIIDAGTAITIDVLTARNEYLGGAILPGALLMHDSLLRRTTGIASRFSGAVQLIGSTTQECVNSGVQHGLVGAVEKIVSQMCAELSHYQTRRNGGIKGDDVGNSAVVKKLITGGDAGLVTNNTSMEYQVVDDLVLQGLAVVAEAHA